MMPVFADLDQERCNQQDSAAEELKIDGITDGYYGNPKASKDLAYLIGYEEGLLQATRELLEDCGQIFDCIACNDEPELYQDELEEEQIPF